LQFSAVTVKDDDDDDVEDDDDDDEAVRTASKRATEDMVSALNWNLRRIHANQNMHSSRCFPPITGEW